MKINVIAAPGVDVPIEHSPRRYITDKKAVEVERSAYYQRIIASGDLIKVEPAQAKNVAKSETKNGK
jgi:hypothetical protein